MQLKMIKRSCPKCREPLVLNKNETDAPDHLACLTENCGHTESLPIDISMQLENAPQLPGF